MEAYFQTGLGILVSVLLFLIGYRQTIGAKKERVKAANEKLIETILRRIILESYSPKRDDLKRIIEGKARDHKVGAKDLLTVDQLLNTLYTRIFENDLISQEEREIHLGRFTALFEIDKRDVKQEIETPIDKSKGKGSKDWDTVIWMFGALVSLTGGVFATYFFDHEVSDMQSFVNSNLIITLISSGLAVSLVYVFLRLKDDQESSEDKLGPRHSHINGVKFERETIKQLRKLNIDLLMPDEKDLGFDLIAIINGQKTAVEIKYWRIRPPFSYVQQVIFRLSSSMAKQNIEHGIILTNEKFTINDRLQVTNNIQVLTIDDLKKKIKTMPNNA